MPIGTCHELADSARVFLTTGAGSCYDGDSGENRVDRGWKAVMSTITKQILEKALVLPPAELPT